MSADAPHRWVCPECNWSSRAEHLVATNVDPAGPLLECPACEIGSPLDAWKKTERATLKMQKGRAK